ncbi:hypothetical protein DICSQDRAFT_183737 [Dichomitus squalens LYAD-421 SS1]|uniref:C3H1-type domain-containing protein n=1 Tax=Dichomitus squalens (strain LYAD-421) TaxID=732165 RepID=R7SL74_DICSQ|nr:uncharacterized protein DICSQDRAFT_183737 [Dichomitus squalens LYAD-421 SS1]EJF56603.1 hypothetical protein DICSQDRAFT_183737 [Dichomitus squalens LYAD-421 SS1]
MAVTTKQLWENAIAHLHDLSNATLFQKAELEARVAELEAELTAVKSAYSNATDMAALDKKAHNAQLSSLNRQISAFSFPQAQDPFVLCVIDGDKLLFHSSLIEQGANGGRQAAQDFTKAVAQELVQQGLTGFERLSFWVTVYLNKKAVAARLMEEGIARPDQFEAFLVGFGQASPRFVIMDAGPGRESTEGKIKEYVKTFIRVPQTLRLFFGGIDDTYFPMYESLMQEDLAGKLVLLQPPMKPTPLVRQMAVRNIRFEGLFSEESLSPIPMRRPGPGLLGISESNLHPHVITNGGLISPQSETQGSISPPPANRTPEGFKHIDPSKPLHKQNPPPCNEHYLMTCSKGTNCKYSHEWLLNAEQLDVLARNAKKAPCNYLKNGAWSFLAECWHETHNALGLTCPYGAKCCWGHVCPSGARCFHLSKGKCWFKGEGMHPPTSPSPVEAA